MFVYVCTYCIYVRNGKERKIERERETLREREREREINIMYAIICYIVYIIIII